MRSTYLPFSAPDFDQSESLAVNHVLDSGWVTTGYTALEFESKFAAAVGAQWAVAVNSCTAAMHLALEAVGLRRGDEVITTPYTFAATAEVVRYFDARPVFVDIDRHSLTIDPAQIESVVSERTRAIIPVHIAGLPARLDDMVAIAARHDLAVIEDAAHAFPSTYKGRMIGQPLPAVAGQSSTRLPRHAVCFSFYATKTITTGEGGMICTNDGALAERCRLMSLHGLNRDAWKRYNGEGNWFYEIVAPGFKYNLTDLAAAIGLAQLAKAESMWQRRAAIARCYDAAFAPLPQLQIPYDLDDCQHAWHLYMLRLNLERLTIDRARFIKELKQRNIGASVHFIPLHIHPYYRQTYGFQPQDFPVSYGEYLREVSLPIYSRMTDADVQDVIDSVHDILALYSR